MARRARLAWAAVLVLGTAVRLAAVDQDLWLDEIWSLDVAAALRSAGDVFAVSFDNNHLVTLAMYWLGADRTALAYRAPSVIAGVLAIALAHRIGRDRDADLAWVYAGVFAVSFPLVVYSVEARGYMPAGACALGAFSLLQRQAPLSPAGLALAWLCIVLGFVAHFSFGIFYAAFAGWSVLRLARAGIGGRRACGAWLALHGVPALVLVALYAPMIGELHSSGPTPAYAEVITEALGWGLALPSALGAPVLGTLAALLVVAGVLGRARQGDSSWLFFLLVTLVVPACLLLVMRPPTLMPRYLLPSVIFLLVLLGDVLVQLVRSRRSLGALALCALVVSNAYQIAPFLVDGRGHYAAAVRYLAAHTKARSIVVGSDHDTRNAKVLAYHARRTLTTRRIIYVPRADQQPQPPPWLILHGFEQPPAPRPSIGLPTGARYLLAKTFPYFGPSGFHWFVYERIDGAGQTPAPR